MNFLLIISTIAAPAAQGTDAPIVVTASREPVALAEAPASATLFEEEALDDLSLPAVPDLLRLSPGVSVAATGPRGTQTQVRIRGAEANHSLIFLDGIRFNDPAAGNEGRFELLTSDALARLEIVRGPQSALWGSEALGGVIAAETADPFRSAGFEGRAEYGSLDSARLFGRYALTSGNVGISGSAGWLRSDGVDSFGGGGERDGFGNRAASLKIEARPSDALRFGATGHWIEGRSEYDGFDPVTFLRADTRDETDNRIAALRGWASGEWNGWSALGEISYLDSANRNRLNDAPLNSTFGDRLTLGGQIARRIGGHRIVAAIDHQAESFRARDTVYFGGTDQDRSRTLTAFAGEWRAEWSPAVITDIALRHDDFSAFADATTLRAALLVRPARGWSFHAAFGEGVAQPTFFDLFGFFPGSFVGNPDLRPERSRGWEAGAAWRNGRFDLAATYFAARLRDEIVDIFTFPSTTENASGTSRRSGIELSAGYRHAEWLSIAANYTYLDADDQGTAGATPIREVRRPRHSANLVAHGTAARFRWGASLAYVGARRDSDFDTFTTVALGDYVLASANLAYQIAPGLEAFARAENAFDADYQDVVGYDTQGRTLHAGVRVAFGR